MPADPMSSNGLRPIRSTSATVTKQARIDITPETMLIISASPSVKPANCHSVAP